MSSGLDLTIPVDSDWGAGAYETGTVYLADNQAGTEIRIEGDRDTLRRLLQDALDDLNAGRDGVDRLLERLRSTAEAAHDAVMAAAVLPPAPVEQRTVAEMESGGWVRWPGQPRWFEITGTSDRPGNPRGFIHYRLTDGTSVARDVDASETFDYLTAEAMGRAAA